MSAPASEEKKERYHGLVALPCATTGIAALQHPNGRTVHNLFEILSKEDKKVMSGPTLDSRFLKKVASHSGFTSWRTVSGEWFHKEGERFHKRTVSQRRRTVSQENTRVFQAVSQCFSAEQPPV